MGVAGFFMWLMERYPMVCKSLSGGPTPIVDCFFIDFNCIIHTAIRSAACNGENGQEELIAEILRYLDTLVQVIRPIKLIYIAVDGPAPFAKCIQQRTRRFTGKADSGSETKFTKSAISVGTEFMENLHKRINQFLVERTRYDPAWTYPCVIYNSYHTPGEGEHKIFDFIRAQRAANSWYENYNCCVYSPDADLIFVCLQSRVEHFSILKDADQTTGKRNPSALINDSGVRFCANDFVLVHIGLLKDLILVDFLNGNTEILDRVIDDFCAISFLLGNDFIPRFPDFSIQKGHFNVALEVYVHFIEQKKFLVERSTFINENLSDFLRDCAMAIAHASNRTVTEDELFTYCQSGIKNSHQSEFDKNPDELMRKLSFAALDSFVWVLQYYTKGCQSWSWSYPYSSAPALIIISKYANEYKPKFEKGEVPTPLECLCSMLPSRSVRLLPTALQPLIKNKDTIAIFEGSSRAMTYDDMLTLRSEINKVKPQLTENETIRNTLMKPFLITQNGAEQIEIEKPLPLGDSQPGIPAGVPRLSALPLKISAAHRPPVRKEGDHFILSAVFPPDMKIPSIKDIQPMVGRTILVGYPYLTPAKVVAVSHFDKVDKSKISVLKSSNSSLGIDIGKTDIIITATPLVYKNFRHTEFEWGNKEIYAYQHTCPIGMSRSMACFREAITLPPMPGMPVIVVDGYLKGQVGTIVSKEERGLVVKMTQRNYPKGIDNIFKNDNKRWIPISQFSKKYNLSQKFIEGVMGNVSSPRYGRNVGLKLVKKSKGADGYVRKIKKDICFTDELVSLFKDYSEKFPQFYKFLSEKGKDFSDDDYKIFVESLGDDCEIILKDVSNWCKDNSPGYTAQMAPLFVTTASKATYEEVEAVLEKASTQPVTDGGLMVFRENNVVWPTKKHNLSAPRRMNGEHVVLAAPSGVIQFGTPGVVIGSFCKGSVAHVAADEEIPFGTTVGGHFRKRRVFVAQTCDLLDA